MEVWDGSAEGVLKDAFTSLRLFFLSKAIFSSVVISKVLFSVGNDVGMGIAEIGSMAMDG